MDFEGKANRLLVSTALNTREVLKSVKNSLTPADAGLKIKQIEAAGETEVSTERVFMEPKIAHTLEKLPEARPMITYFVDAIERKNPGWKRDTEGGEEGKQPNEPSSESSVSIPYSFVSSLAGDQLAENEIILTRWAASDLGVEPGDSIRLKYLEIGPLRQLIHREARFILKEVVPMDRIWVDSTRMPVI